LISSNRTYVARPTKSTTGRMSSAKTTKPWLKDVAWATSASATVAPESRVRNMLARANDSFHERERVASRLQCSVARIWTRSAFAAASMSPR